MTVTESHETVGTWGGTLIADTPDDILDAIEPFGHIIITPTDMAPGAADGTNILGQALYTGVVSPRSEHRTSIGGYGLAWHLGPGGDLAGGTITTSSLDAEDLVGTFVLTGGDCNGITAGQITASATARTINIKVGVSRLTILRTICDTFGLEWRVNPDGTLDVDTRANLYAAAPTAMVTPRWGGADHHVVGFRADIDLADDVDDYRNIWVVQPETGANQTSSVTNPYYGLTGAALVREGFTDASSTAPGTTQAAAIAAQQRGRFDQVREEMSVDLADAETPRADIAPGDRLWVWEPRLGIVGTDQVHYRGHLLDPAVVRVVEVVWPIEPHMGKFYRCPDASGTLIRLTDYWRSERSVTSLGVGAFRRTFAAAAWVQS